MHTTRRLRCQADRLACDARRAEGERSGRKWGTEHRVKKGEGSLGCSVHPCRYWHRRTHDYERVGSAHTLTRCTLLRSIIACLFNRLMAYCRVSGSHSNGSTPSLISTSCTFPTSPCPRFLMAWKCEGSTAPCSSMSACMI
eukprot:5639415-Pyramimonas_sp.AAC.1